VQDPHPPIFYSGNSDESAIFAGHNGLSIAIGFAPPPKIKQQIEVYRTACREAGWEPTNENVLYRCRAIIGATDADATEQANKQAAGPRARASAPGAAPGAGAPAGAGGGDPTSGAAGVQLLGGPETIVKKAQALYDIGVGILDVGLVGSTKRSLELFGKSFAEPLKEVA
jgi:alkanesulfonate monooxygenase SsuD/methylene tetrahydromethanopterin reductase-like flavin-dependent oxidoreductase (luciferase family)